MPATQRRVLTSNFRVIKNWEVFKQQLSNRVTRFAPILLDRIETAAAVRVLIFDVMTKQSAKFEIMVASHLGEVVLPGEKVLMILPRCLMPEIANATCTPTDSRKTGTFNSREDGRH